MHKKSIEVKKLARFSLLGHLSTTVGATAFYIFLSFVLAEITSASVPGNTLGFYLLAQAILYIVDVLMGVFEYGLCSIYMKLQYLQPTFFRDIFQGFHENTDRILAVRSVLSAAETLALLPGSLVLNYTDLGIPAALLLYAAGIIVTAWVQLRYALSFYLLLDYPQLSAKDAMKHSAKLMKGRKRILLYLDLSFIPLYALSILSFGIAALWVLSYQDAGRAAFYHGIVTRKI